MSGFFLRLTLGVFLLGVVGQRGGHSEAHVAVLAVVRFLSGVEPHVVLQRGGGGEFGAARLAGVRLLLKMLRALVVNHTWTGY